MGESKRENSFHNGNLLLQWTLLSLPGEGLDDDAAADEEQRQHSVTGLTTADRAAEVAAAAADRSGFALLHTESSVEAAASASPD